MSTIDLGRLVTESMQRVNAQYSNELDLASVLEGDNKDPGVLQKGKDWAVKKMQGVKDSKFGQHVSNHGKKYSAGAGALGAAGIIGAGALAYRALRQRRQKAAQDN